MTPHQTPFLHLLKNNKKRTFIGFTLVELIVVIVILAILATIAFLSFNSYSANSRDSVRLGDLNQLNKGIELYQVKAGIYPLPDGLIATGIVNSVSVAYKGEIGDKISRMINISKTPLDPLTSVKYIYGVSTDKRLFQIATSLEDGGNVSHDFNNGLIEQAFAGGNPISRVIGNYPGYIKYSSGSNIFISNIPSMIFNLSGSISNPDLVGDADNLFFVVDRKENLPYRLASTTIINNKDGNDLIKEIKGDAATLTGVNITSIINAATPEEKTQAIETVFGSSNSSPLITSFGNSFDEVKNIVTGGGVANVGVSNQNGNENTPSFACGNSNGKIYSAAPNTELCSNGDPSSLTSSGNTWIWSCGSNGSGTGVSCNANIGDPYWNNVSLLLHGDGVDGSKTIIDSTAKNTVSIVGTGYISSSVSKFGGSSIYVDTAGYLKIPANSVLNMGNNDFTIEFWAYTTGGAGNTNWRNNVISGSGWSISTINPGYTAGRHFCADAPGAGCGGYTKNFNATVTSNGWDHMALVRYGNDVKMFKNGNVFGTSATIFSSDENFETLTPSSGIFIGQSWAGYIDDLRITKGVARYLSSFSAPTKAFPEGQPTFNNGVCGSEDGTSNDVTPTSNFCSVGTPTSVVGTGPWHWYCIGSNGGGNSSCNKNYSDPNYSNVVTLLRLNGSDGGTTFTDEKGKTVTTSSVVTTTAQSKFGGGSAYFNNASNLAIASHSDYNFGTGDFTVEAWIMYDTGATSGWHALFDLSNAKFLARTNNGNYEAFSPTTSIGGNLIWQHIAYVRNNGTMYLYINGVQKGSYAHTTNITAGTLLIGAYYNASHRLLGYMNELRITKGVARYSGSSFSVPISKFPNN